MTNKQHAFSANTINVSLTVRNLQASLAWYRDVVGFTVDKEHERDGKLLAVSLKAGEVRILINEDDGKLGMDREKGAGFSMQFLTSQNIDEVANHIKASGGSLATEPADMPWGARVFRIQDPDGFKIVISSVGV